MEAINQKVVTYLLNASWQITVIVGLGHAFGAFLRRMPFRYKHVVWIMCLGACVLVPLVTLVFQPYAGGGMTSATTAAASGSDQLSGNGPGVPFRFHSRSHAISFPGNLISALVWSYAAFVFFQLIRFGWSYRRTLHIRKSAFARGMPARLLQSLEECSAKFSLPAIRVLCSPEIGSPSTLGHVRPVLILPEHFFETGIGEQEVMAALGHELAHIRRRDFGLNLLYEVASLPICFHPLSLLIRARLAQTREMACDEMAAALLPSVTDYARSLVRLAQTMFAAAPSATTSYAMGLFDTRALEERIMNILDTGKRSGKGARMRMLFTVGIIGAMSLAICGFSVRVADHAAAAQQRFVGTWEAQYKGRAFFTLRISEQNGSLGGSCLHVTRLAKMGTKTGGELIPTTDETTQEPIREARIRGGKLELQIGDNKDPILLDLLPTGDNSADGNIVGDPSDPFVHIKPWHFQRVSATP